MKRKYKFKIPVEVMEVSHEVDLGVGYYRPGSGALKK